MVSQALIIQQQQALIPSSPVTIQTTRHDRSTLLINTSPGKEAIPPERKDKDRNRGGNPIEIIFLLIWGIFLINQLDNKSER